MSINLPYVHSLSWVIVVTTGKEPGASAREVVGQVEEYGVGGGHPLLDPLLIWGQDVIGILLVVGVIQLFF